MSLKRNLNNFILEYSNLFQNQQKTEKKIFVSQDEQQKVKEIYQSDDNGAVEDSEKSDDGNDIKIQESGKEFVFKNKSKFIDFYRSIYKIKDNQINLENLRNFLTVKIESFPQPKEIIEIYEKVLKKSSFSRYQKKNWSSEEIILFLWIIVKYCEQIGIDIKAMSEHHWNDIAQIFPGKSTDQCKDKWLSMQKNYLQLAPWSQEEDDALLEIINEKGTNKWTEIAKELNMRSTSNVYRAGKQCRERWNNHLDPILNRGPWTPQEDIILLKLAVSIGKKWSEISKKLQGRTENSVKNRFNSLIKKENQMLQEQSDLKQQDTGLSQLNSDYDELNSSTYQKIEFNQEGSSANQLINNNQFKIKQETLQQDRFDFKQEDLSGMIEIEKEDILKINQEQDDIFHDDSSLNDKENLLNFIEAKNKIKNENKNNYSNIICATTLNNNLNNNRNLKSSLADNSSNLNIKSNSGNSENQKKSEKAKSQKNSKTKKKVPFLTQEELKMSLQSKDSFEKEKMLIRLIIKRKEVELGSGQVNLPLLDNSSIQNSNSSPQSNQQKDLIQKGGKGQSEDINEKADPLLQAKRRKNVNAVVIGGNMIAGNNQLNNPNKINPPNINNNMNACALSQNNNNKNNNLQDNNLKNINNSSTPNSFQNNLQVFSNKKIQKQPSSRSASKKNQQNNQELILQQNTNSLQKQTQNQQFNNNTGQMGQVVQNTNGNKQINNGAINKSNVLNSQNNNNNSLNSVLSNSINNNVINKLNNSILNNSLQKTNSGNNPQTSNQPQPIFQSINHHQKQNNSINAQNQGEGISQNNAVQKSQGQKEKSNISDFLKSPQNFKALLQYFNSINSMRNNNSANVNNASANGAQDQNQQQNIQQQQQISKKPQSQQQQQQPQQKLQSQQKQNLQSAQTQIQSSQQSTNQNQQQRTKTIGNFELQQRIQSVIQDKTKQLQQQQQIQQQKQQQQVQQQQQKQQQQQQQQKQQLLQIQQEQQPQMNLEQQQIQQQNDHHLQQYEIKQENNLQGNINLKFQHSPCQESLNDIYQLKMQQKLDDYLLGIENFIKQEDNNNDRQDASNIEPYINDNINLDDDQFKIEMMDENNKNLSGNPIFSSDSNQILNFHFNEDILEQLINNDGNNKISNIRKNSNKNISNFDDINKQQQNNQKFNSTINSNTINRISNSIGIHDNGLKSNNNSLNQNMQYSQSNKSINYNNSLQYQNNMGTSNPIYNMTYQTQQCSIYNQNQNNNNLQNNNSILQNNNDILQNNNSNLQNNSNFNLSNNYVLNSDLQNSYLSSQSQSDFSESLSESEEDEDDQYEDNFNQTKRRKRIGSTGSAFTKYSKKKLLEN